HVRHQSGGSWNRFGFTGHEHDQETGLIYAKARYYDPDTGRFLSQDAWAGDNTIAPSLHKYLYAYMNPTLYWDPDGNQTVHKWQGEDGQWHFSDKPGPGQLGTVADSMPKQTPESRAYDACAANRNCFEKFLEARH